jgi:hypothetical protein
MGIIPALKYIVKNMANLKNFPKIKSFLLIAYPPMPVINIIPTGPTTLLEIDSSSALRMVLSLNNMAYELKLIPTGSRTSEPRSMPGDDME